MEAHERALLLTALLEAPERCGDITNRLQASAWDSDEELVELSRSHLIKALERVVVGALLQAEVENWANALEGRDDVGLESGHEGVIREAVHWMANPVLEGKITPASARTWLGRLQK